MRLRLRKHRNHHSHRIHRSTSLAELREGEEGILLQIALPEDIAQRLMELGFVPGFRVQASHLAPGGGARVFRVDGAEIALRKETAARLRIEDVTAVEPSAGERS